MALTIELTRGSRARVETGRASECCLLHSLLENSYLTTFTFVAQIAPNGPWTFPTCSTGTIRSCLGGYHGLRTISIPSHARTLVVKGLLLFRNGLFTVSCRGGSCHQRCNGGEQDFSGAEEASSYH